MKQLVSVVIPVFNAELFLERTLLSVQQQTYEKLEIIIVNDGSTDTSGQIAARYALSDPRFQVITQRNSGVASARNYGLQRSSGEYVTFLDADDIWHPTKIERQMDVLLSSTNSAGLGTVYSLTRYINSQDRGCIWKILERAWKPRSPFSGIGTLCEWKQYLDATRLDAAVGGYDTSYKDLKTSGAEDVDFELKLAARFPMFVISEYLIGYADTRAACPTMMLVWKELLER